MTATHKTDRHARGRPKNQRPRAPKEEATFDTELQRYVMPGERRVTVPKHGKGRVRHKEGSSSSGNKFNRR